ncbi:hypothetical protein [Brevundimonas sp.]|nr:hypothetical protein [Brevundimonas sp.]
MTMTPQSREDAPPAFHKPGELHPGLYLVIGFALLLGVAFGVNALFRVIL